MRRLRLFVTFLVPVVALLAFADPALAVTHAGEGLYGATNDVNITNAMFFLIIFFPTVILVMSLLQALLHHRKHLKWEKQKVAEAAHRDKGGW